MDHLVPHSAQDAVSHDAALQVLHHVLLGEPLHPVALVFEVAQQAGDDPGSSPSLGFGEPLFVLVFESCLAYLRSESSR